MPPAVPLEAPARDIAGAGLGGHPDQVLRQVEEPADGQTLNLDRAPFADQVEPCYPARDAALEHVQRSQAQAGKALLDRLPQRAVRAPHRPGCRDLLASHGRRLVDHESRTAAGDVDPNPIPGRHGERPDPDAHIRRRCTGLRFGGQQGGLRRQGHQSPHAIPAQMQPTVVDPLQIPGHDLERAPGQGPVQALATLSRPHSGQAQRLKQVLLRRSSSFPDQRHNAAFDACGAGRPVSGQTREDVAREFRVAAATRREERLERFTGPDQYLSPRSRHRLVRARMLHLQSAIDLALGRCADVVALVVELAVMTHRVGARGDRLRLGRFDLGVEVRAQLDRHDSAHIVLERRRVHDVQTRAVVHEQFESTPVAAAENADDAPGRLEPEPPARNPTDALDNADSLDLEGGILQHRALNRDPTVVEPFDPEPAARLLDLLPAVVAPDPNPVQPGGGVEDRVRFLLEQRREPGGKLPCLPPVPQRRYLEPMNARTRLPRRRPNAEASFDFVPFAVLGHQPRGRFAASNFEPVQVRSESHPDLRRQHDRAGRRSRVGDRNRPSRGHQQAGQRDDAQAGSPRRHFFSGRSLHRVLPYVIGNRRKRRPLAPSAYRC